MAAAVIPFTPADAAVLRALVADASLAPEYGWLVGAGELVDPLRHPHVAAGGIWLAVDDDRPAGFAMLMVRPSTQGRQAMVRLGVIASKRRRGIGSSLLVACERRIAALSPAERPRLTCLSAWLPTDTAPAFAARHGFSLARTFWNMERADVAAAAPVWPAGIEVRTFDGSDRMLEDWNQAYNRSFAENALAVSSTLEECRWLCTQEHFRPDGLVLAYRAGTIVGFCRNAVHPGHGEVDVLGVVPEARGIGLGRALLRWGSAWFAGRGKRPVRLFVDGENESALALYRSEGFDTVRTRQLWSRA